MKGLKTILVLTCLLGVTAVHVNAATVTWLDHSFLYAVNTNGANLFTDPDPSSFTGIVGPTPVFSKDFGSTGDAITSSADSSAASNAGLDLVLKAGASGDHLADGVKQNAYLESASGQNNGISSPYGVEPDGTFTQQVTGFSIRRFEVDSPGAFLLNGLLTGGEIDADGVYVPGPPIPAIVNYNYSGGITLFENILDSSGTVTSVATVATIDILDLLAAGAGNPVSTPVQLRTQAGADAVNYDLKVQINLDGFIVNFNSYAEAWSVIPEGSLGFMGTQANPLDIEATLSPVPIPGTCILLFSGLAALIGYRRRIK